MKSVCLAILNYNGKKHFELFAADGFRGREQNFPAPVRL